MPARRQFDMIVPPHPDDEASDPPSQFPSKGQRRRQNHILNGCACEGALTIFKVNVSVTARIPANAMHLLAIFSIRPDNSEAAGARARTRINPPRAGFSEPY